MGGGGSLVHYYIARRVDSYDFTDGVFKIYPHSKILSFRRPSILEWLEFANLTKGVLTNSGTIGPHFSRPDSIALFLAITHFTLMKSNPPRALLMDILSMEFSQRQTIPSLEVPSVDSLSKISLKGIIEEIIR